MRNMCLKRISSITDIGTYIFSMIPSSYAQGQGASEIPVTKVKIENKVEEAAKKSLDYETAIKKCTFIQHYAKMRSFKGRLCRTRLTIIPTNMTIYFR